MRRHKRHAFSLIANFKNSARGLMEVTRNERPMQVEAVCFVLMTALLAVLEMPFGYKLILFVSLFLPIFTELLNSAIERTVDLVTLEYHDLAKTAKDAASAAVLISLVVTGTIWAGVFYIVYFGG
ncbi:MAG: diacylglycerol kinase [Campylobacterales bacterium]